MAKLKLEANPTFTAPVPVPVPGGEPVKVQMTFKHRTKTQLAEFLSSVGDPGKTDADVFLEMVSGWELEYPFTKENVELLNEQYSGAIAATINAYAAELAGAREKNSGR